MKKEEWTRLSAALMVAASCVISPVASATSYIFSVDYNGSTATLKTGSSDPRAVDLKAGDSFSYNLFANGDSFWSVNGGGISYFAALYYPDAGTREIIDFTAAVLNDGVVQSSANSVSMSNSYAHIGDMLEIAPFTKFDQLSFSGTMTSSTAARNVAFDLLPFLGAPQQNVGTQITYVAPTAAVPEASTWIMMILGFGAVGYSLRRRTKVSFASAI